MNKKLTRTLAGVMSLMFMGQIMIFGDGSAQGLLHADTIASAAEAIEGAKNKDQLAKEFEEATKDLGKVDFFDVAEDKMKLLIMRRLQKMIFLFNPNQTKQCRIILQLLRLLRMAMLQQVN